MIPAKEAYLALDENDPNQACLMAGGDCINKITRDALLELQEAPKMFRSAIPAIINNVSKNHDLHPHFLWWAMFRRKQWPPMSSSDKKMLRLAQQVFEASGAWRPQSLSPISGNPGWTIPEDMNAVDKAFADLVKVIRQDLRKPLLRKWAKISAQAIKEVQKKCDEVFGIPCSPKEASELLYGDITRMVLYNRVPGPHPNLVTALLDLD
jgi:hypothetical protein